MLKMELKNKFMNFVNQMVENEASIKKRVMKLTKS